MATCARVAALKKVLFPTFGLPTTPTMRGKFPVPEVATYGLLGVL